MIPRSVRNNNPGNIERGQKWQGLMPLADMTPEQLAEPRFAVFKSPVWGFRALAKTLLTYQRRYKLNTVREIINRWAPPMENNTSAYVSAVAKAVGVSPDCEIDLTDDLYLTGIASAIAKHESGGKYFMERDVIAGCALALHRE